MELSFPYELVLGALLAAVWLAVASATAAEPAPVTGRAPRAPHRYEPPARLLLGRWLSGGRSDRESRAAYRDIIARIAAEAHPNAAVILVGPSQPEAFAAHRQDTTPVYALPRGGTHPAAVRLEMAAATAPYERVYVIYGGDAEAADPQQAIERYLAVYAFKIADERMDGARLAVYEIGFKTPVEAVSRRAPFAGLDGETITLVEHSIWPATSLPGGVAHARLAWATDQTPSRRYGVALELIDGAGRVVARHGSEPAGGWQPTTGWQPAGAGLGDGLVIDGTGLLLPPDLPPGAYTLRLGLYDAFDPNARLAVAGADGVHLGEITITGP
jgi:hypothetical protein